MQTGCGGRCPSAGLRPFYGPDYLQIPARREVSVLTRPTQTAQAKQATAQVTNTAGPVQSAARPVTVVAIALSDNRAWNGHTAGFVE